MEVDYHSTAFFPVLVVFLHEAGGMCQQGSLAPSALHRGKEFVADSFEFQRMSNVNTLINCGRLCLARSHCKSFTYNEAGGTCKAFSITSNDTYPLQTSNVSTLVYVEADQLPKMLVGPCGNRPCQPFEACIEESPTTYRCAATGRCTSAPQVPNAAVVSLDFVKAEYACNNNTIQGRNADGNTGQSWCIGNNVWTEPNIRCSLCPAPPALVNADLVNVVADEAATFMCSVGYINVRATTNTIFTSVCSDNTWTIPDYKCSDTKDCYYYNTTRGRAIYSGVLATSSAGNECIHWSTTHLASSVTRASINPETLADVRNYCRDADDGYWRYPWCYNESRSAERCGIPQC